MITIPGTCRFCHCTQDNPCKVYPFDDGAICGWMPDSRETVCSGKNCQDAWTQFKRAELANRPKRKTPADVHAEICGRKPGRKKEASA
jgi:hypothetical protein